MNEIEIFGMNKATRRHRRGCYLTVNSKNRNAYISYDACKMIFGNDLHNPERLLIIHSKIEGVWYFAKAGGNLFSMQGGYDVVRNDPKCESSIYRINGANDVLASMTKELSGKNLERAEYSFDPNPKQYEGMTLYRVIFNK